MLIYSCDVKLNMVVPRRDWDEKREMFESWGYLSSVAQVNSEKGTKVFIKKAARDRMTMCAVVDSITCSDINPEKLFNTFIKQVGLDCSIHEIREETIKFLIDALLFLFP